MNKPAISQKRKIDEIKPDVSIQKVKEIRRNQEEKKNAFDILMENSIKHPNPEKKFPCDKGMNQDSKMNNAAKYN